MKGASAMTAGRVDDLGRAHSKRLASVPPVVYVTATLPWPITSGGQMRTAANLAALCALGPTHLVAFPPAEVALRPGDTAKLASVTIDPLPRPPLAALLAQRLEAAARFRHVYVVRWLRAGGLKRLVARVAETQAEIVVLEWPFYPLAIDGLRSQCPAVRLIVVDPSDDRVAVSASTIRHGTRISQWVRTTIDHPALVRSEAAMDRADQVWFASDQDAAASARRHPGLDVRVVPNVVDEPRLAAMALQAEPPTPNSAAFLGSFDYPPNEIAGLRFVRDVAPKLRVAVPQAILALVGRAPTPAIRAATDGGSVTLLGDVPDAAAALLRFRVLVVPLTIGSGTRLKILEALALGVPVVTTTVGLSGLPFVDDVHLLVGQTDTELAAATLRIWGDPDLARRLTTAGAAVVRERYGPTAHRRLVRDAITVALAAV